MRDCLVLYGVLGARTHVVPAALAAAEEADHTLVVLVEAAETSCIELLDSLVSERLVYCAVQDLTATQNVLDVVLECARTQALRPQLVYNTLDRYTTQSAWLADQLNIARNAQAPLAGSKFAVRQQLQHSQDLAVPFSKLEHQDDAARWVSEQSGEWVIKPSHGAGSRGITTSISTPQLAQQAWHRCAEYLRQDAFPGKGHVLIEQQLQGCEVDVELVLQEGVTYFAAVADNPEVVLPFQVESATTYPSQLSANLQAQCIAHAEAALRTLSYTDGNFHVEMVCTAAGPKIIEVNPRMGGAFVWHAISAAYHVDLVRMGILAGLHRLMPTPYTEPNAVFEARFFIAETSGTLAQVEGIEHCATLPGVHDISLWKQAGDAVACPRDDTADYLGFVLVDGKNYLQACERADEALAAVTFAIN